MTSMKRWLNASIEDFEDVSDDNHALDQAPEEIGEDIEIHVHEMQDLVQAKEALESYIDFISESRAARKNIDPMTARAIYIGVESHGVHLKAAPSVESFGQVSVSIELLDKLKDGAKYVGDKIKKAYEYIMELIQKFFDLFRKKAEKVKEEVKETKARVVNFTAPKSAVAEPKPVEPTSNSVKAEVLAIGKTASKELAIYEAPTDPKYVALSNVGMFSVNGKNLVVSPKQLTHAVKGLTDAAADYLHSFEDYAEEFFQEKKSGSVITSQLKSFFSHGKNGDLFKGDFGNLKDDPKAPIAFGFDCFDFKVMVKIPDGDAYLGSCFKVQAVVDMSNPKIANGGSAITEIPNEAAIESLLDVADDMLDSSEELNISKLIAGGALKSYENDTSAETVAKLMFIKDNFVLPANKLVQFYIASSDRLVEVANQLMNSLAIEGEKA